MNINKDILIGFGVGLLTGGGLGTYVATKQAEARADAEIQSVKDEFRKMMGETNEKVGRLEKVVERAGEAGFIYEDAANDERVSDEALEGLRQKLLAGPPIAEAEKLEVEDAAIGADKRRIYADQEKIDIHGDEPYVITVDQFQDEHITGPDEHDKQTVTYFAGDNKLVDNRDQIIKNVGNTVGNIFDRFGDGSGEEHIVYVRNCWLTVDFEIVREEGTFEAYLAQGKDDWENEVVELPKQPVLRMRRD